MPHGVLCGELLLHDSCCFMCGFSLTDRMVFYVGTFSYTPVAVLCGDFSYTPHAVSRGEFLMHTRALFCGEFLLHVPCCFMCGDSLTRSMLLYVRIFFFLFFTWPLLSCAGNFSYTLRTVLFGAFSYMTGTYL